MAEEDFDMGVNPNDEEEIETPKREKKKESSLPSSDFLNISTSKQFLEAIEYASLKLEKSVEELKSFQELGEIKKHLADLKNIELDTSAFEKQFETVLLELKNKMDDVKDKVDLNELDEISSKISQINKKTKHQKNFGYLVVALLAFGLGWLGKTEATSDDLTQSEIAIVEEFKNSKKIAIGQNRDVKYILLKSRLVNSGNYKAIIIKKEGK